MSENIIIALIGAFATIIGALISRPWEPSAKNKTSFSWKKIVLGVLIAILLASPAIWFLSEKAIDTTSIAGDWSGRVEDDENNASIRVVLRIENFCYRESLCGTVYIPEKSYPADLKLISVSNNVFRFEEINIKGDARLRSGGYNYIHVQENGTLFRLFSSHDGFVTSRGTFTQQ